MRHKALVCWKLAKNAVQFEINKFCIIIKNSGRIIKHPAIRLFPMFDCEISTDSLHLFAGTLIIYLEV